MKKDRPFVIFIIGVSGVGKSTIGILLAKKLSIPFFDGDDYHAKEHIKQMSEGKSLTDENRFEWLQSLNNLARIQLQNNSCVIACSALKENYRNILKKDIEIDTKWVFLNGTFKNVMERLKNRPGHFMPPELLKSQFAILEEPIEAISIDIKKNPTHIVASILSTLNKSEIGLIGLGVMGKSLSRNLALNGFHISLYNRHVPKKEVHIANTFVKKHTELATAKPFDDLKNFVESLQQPRKILLMVNAGKPVDVVLENLSPILSKNDVVVDGGNSHYKETQRRMELLKKNEIHFVGAGISGGEEGAFHGPSIMPGGAKNAYDLVAPFLKTISAKNKNNEPCCTYIGEGGAGHFVKMVHNGIEYAEMQLLAEVYQILKKTGHNPDEIATILDNWKKEASSYLLEATVDILRKKEGAHFLIDKILDVSENKGTGNWTTVASSELGTPSTMIASALFARYLSSYKKERVAMSAASDENVSPSKITTDILLNAYQLARLINHHQGFKLMSEAAHAYKWNLSLSNIASIWTEGCIIRSTLMEKLAEELKRPEPILLHPSFSSLVQKWKPALTKMASKCIENEIAIPCFSEAINFINGYSDATSSANLIQAQRDYFGAHTYQRVDDPTEKFYHTNWKKLK